MITIRQKNVVPHFRGLDLGAQMEFLHAFFFIPLVQREFYQEISTTWSEHQYPSTRVPAHGAVHTPPPRVICSITQFNYVDFLSAYATFFLPLNIITINNAVR